MRGAIGLFSLLGFLIYTGILIVSIFTKRPGKKSYLAGMLISVLIFTGTVYIPGVISNVNKKAGETEETQKISLEAVQSDNGAAEPKSPITQQGESVKPEKVSAGNVKNSSESTAKARENQSELEPGWQYGIYVLPKSDVELKRTELKEFSVVEFKDGDTVYAKGVEWSLEGDIGTIATNVNNPVMFTAEKVGQGTVRARFGGKEFSWKVVVKPMLNPLNVKITGKGRVAKNPDKALYEEGEIVTLTAIPDAGWDLYHWDTFGPGETASKTTEIKIGNHENYHDAVFSQVVTFQDMALENVVRRYTGRRDGNILADELKLISSLSAGSAGIKSLEGIQFLINLHELDLSNNSISSIEPLRNLKQLTSLHLGGNNISDYSPVQGYYDQLKDRDFQIP